jgi:phospholipase/carboxylesterase
MRARSRRACSWLLRATLLLAWAAPGVQAQGSQHSAFRPPNADGWGEAAGLRYLEAISGGASSDERLPMIVFIHGLGDRARLSWLEYIARDVRARVIVPQATTPSDDGFAWFSVRARDGKPRLLAKQIHARADQLSAALALLRARRPTLGLPIVVGFSQGGMLSYALAVREPAALRLAIPISGMLPEPLWPRRRPQRAAVPIRALHGDADRTVVFAATQALVARLRRLHFDATLSVFPEVGHQITPAMRELVRTTISHALAEPPHARRKRAVRPAADGG